VIRPGGQSIFSVASSGWKNTGKSLIYLPEAKVFAGLKKSVKKLLFFARKSTFLLEKNAFRVYIDSIVIYWVKRQLFGV